MNRRRFGALVAGAATLGSASALTTSCLSMYPTDTPDKPEPASRRPSPKTVELAIATICTDGFGNQGHEPAFRVLPQLGFTNVEFNLWYPDTITPRYIQSIRQRCQTAGLRPVSLQGSGFGGEGRTGIVKDIAHKLLFMQHCRQLGCQIVKFTGSKRDTAGGLPAVLEVCRELAPAAEDLGILLTLENHAGNVLENLRDYETLFSQIDSPNVGLCLDTGHFEGVGIDLHEVLERFAPRTLHVDLKDCRQRGQGHDTVPFGQGVTDFDSFLSHLIETGYRGYLVIEQAWKEPQGRWQDDLKSAYERFRKWERS